MLHFSSVHISGFGFVLFSQHQCFCMSQTKVSFYPTNTKEAILDLIQTLKSDFVGTTEMMVVV